MKKIILLAFVAMLLTPIRILAQNSLDDFGVWTELGIEKKLKKGFSIGLDGEVRTEDNSSKVDRLNIGIGGEYKLNRFVQFGLGYMFMGYYSAEKTIDKYSDSGKYKGYNVDASHWTPRHRVYADVTFGCRANSWLRLSMRERYQMTYSQETSFDETKYRKYTDSETGEISYLPKEVVQDTASAGATHYLRHRFMVEYDRKKCKWNPYISTELHYNLSKSLHIDKIRNTIGCDYKITKHHTVGLAYVLTIQMLSGESVERMHSLNVSYKCSL